MTSLRAPRVTSGPCIPSSRRYYVTGKRLTFPRQERRRRLSEHSCSTGRKTVVQPRAAVIFIRGAALLAARIAAQFIIPARLLVVTATRTAGLRFIIAGLNVTLVVLAAVMVLEKMFGWKKRLQRTLIAKEMVLEQLDDTRDRKSMLELVLQKTKNNLGSLSSIDEDNDEGNTRRASSSCPLCGGTGKIVYEGKMRHEDPCPRCALVF